jgi:hypothetical protein
VFWSVSLPSILEIVAPDINACRPVFASERTLTLHFISIISFNVEVQQNRKMREITMHCQGGSIVSEVSTGNHQVGVYIKPSSKAAWSFPSSLDKV